MSLTSEVDRVIAFKDEQYPTDNVTAKMRAYNKLYKENLEPLLHEEKVKDVAVSRQELDDFNKRKDVVEKELNRLLDNIKECTSSSSGIWRDESKEDLAEMEDLAFSLDRPELIGVFASNKLGSVRDVEDIKRYINYWAMTANCYSKEWEDFTYDCITSRNPDVAERFKDATINSNDGYKMLCVVRDLVENSKTQYLHTPVGLLDVYAQAILKTDDLNVLYSFSEFCTGQNSNMVSADIRKQLSERFEELTHQKQQKDDEIEMV